jgi:lysophospholipase L1-like esterase
MSPARGVSLFLVGILACADPARGEPARLPVVVLIGDSIRMGYEPIVRERLKGVAEVISVKENGGDSANVLKNLDAWAIAPKPAVIHFNAGLHDLKTDPKTGIHQVALNDYRANLQAIVDRLEKETSARLIFATTTPVIDVRHNEVKPFLRRNNDVRGYNVAAKEVLSASPGVAIDDLNALAVRLVLESVLLDDGVHFTRAGYEALGEQVASAIKSALNEPPVMREVACRWAEKPPVIDGKLDDPAWAGAVVIDRFPTFWKNLDNGPGTRARLVWDDDALYFAATMTDHELRSFGTKHNDTLWHGDVFELFFKPGAERPEYYEFQVNPRSVLLELAFPKRGFDFATLAAKPPMGMSAVATVEGTLDQPGDRDEGWTVEGRIPWSIFTPTGGKPRPGDAWLFALCRYDYGPAGTEPVLMSSAPLTRPSFHRYEDYGRVVFRGDGK